MGRPFVDGTGSGPFFFVYNTGNLSGISIQAVWQSPFFFLSSFKMVTNKVKQKLRRRLGRYGRAIQKHYKAYLWYLEDLQESHPYFFDDWEFSDSGDERFCGGCLQIMDPVTAYIGGPAVHPREWTCHQCD